MDGKFKKGDTKKGGRQKGTPNKTPASVANMFLDVAEDLGGKAALLKWASNSRNQTQFYTLLAKLMPKTVEATSNEDDANREKLDKARARVNGSL